MHPRLLIVVVAGLLAPSLAGAAGPAAPGYDSPKDGSPERPPGYGPDGTPTDGSPGYGEPAGTPPSGPDGSGYGGSGGYGYGDGSPGYGGAGGYGYGDGAPGYGGAGGYGYGDGAPGYGGAGGYGYGEPPPYDRPPDDGMPTYLSDAEIVGVLHTVNQGEVLAGQQAQRKAEALEVRGFGARMVAEHSALDQRLLELTGQLGISPAPSRLTQKLLGATEHVLGKLERFSGPTYDVAYVDIQLAGHGGVVALLDFLGTKAALPELRAAIDEARPLILSHLEGATSLRKQLQGVPIEPGPAGY